MHGRHTSSARGNRGSDRATRLALILRSHLQVDLQTSGQADLVPTSYSKVLLLVPDAWAGTGRAGASTMLRLLLISNTS